LAAAPEVVFAVAPEVAELQVVSVVAQPKVFAAAAPEAVSAIVEPQAFFPAADPKAFFSVSELQVFFAAVVLEAVPEAAEPQACSVVAVPQVVFAQSEVSVMAQPKVFAAAALEAASEVAEPQVFFAAAQLQVASVVVASEAVSVDIAFAFVVLVPASVAVAGADSSGRPKFSVFPNADPFASSSSSVEVAAEESAHSPIGDHTSYDLCSIFSSLDLHHNKKLGHCYNNSNPGYNTVIDTNGLPMGATTNHPRRTNLLLCQAQRKHHLYRESRSHPEVPQMRSMVVRNSSRLHPGFHNPVRQGYSSPGETGIAVRQLFLTVAFFSWFPHSFIRVLSNSPHYGTTFFYRTWFIKEHKILVWLPPHPAFRKDCGCKFTLS